MGGTKAGDLAVSVAGVMDGGMANGSQLLCPRCIALTRHQRPWHAPRQAPPSSGIQAPAAADVQAAAATSAGGSGGSGACDGCVVVSFRAPPMLPPSSLTSRPAAHRPAPPVHRRSAREPLHAPREPLHAPHVACSRCGLPPSRWVHARPEQLAGSQTGAAPAIAPMARPAGTAQPVLQPDLRPGELQPAGMAEGRSAKAESSAEAWVWRPAPTPAQAPMESA